MQDPLASRKKLYRDLLREYHPDRNGEAHSVHVCHYLTSARGWFFAGANQTATSHAAADAGYAERRIREELQALPAHWRHIAGSPIASGDYGEDRRTQTTGTSSR